jgi:phytoene dehydrogenase-like protein
MADAAADAGADLRWRADVSALECSSGRVRAVHLTSGERIPCDVVVLTCELPAAYRLLERTPRRPAPLRHSPSAVILHAGTDRTWPHLAHHTISFGAAWERSFDELTRTGELMSDPSLLITRSTTHDPDLAPPGRHLHYVLAPCPNTTVGPSAAAWRDLGPRYRDRLASELERRGLDGFADSIDKGLLVTRSTGRCGAMRPAVPCRWPTPSPRPGRSAHATSYGRWRTSYWQNAGPLRASACRRCSSAASSPPRASRAAPLGPRELRAPVGADDAA